MGTHGRQVHRFDRGWQGGEPPGDASLDGPQEVQFMAGKLQVGQCFLLQGSLVRIWLGTVGAVRVGQPLLGTVTIPNSTSG